MHSFHDKTSAKWHIIMEYMENACVHKNLRGDVGVYKSARCAAGGAKSRVITYIADTAKVRWLLSDSMKYLCFNGLG